MGGSFQKTFPTLGARGDDMCSARRGYIFLITMDVQASLHTPRLIPRTLRELELVTTSTR